MRWRRFEQLTGDLLYEILRFRQDIFVVEQRSAYPDLDGLDLNARHLLMRLEGGLAGYLRLVPPTGPQLGKIGRVAVAAPLRHRGLGRHLIGEALRHHGESYRGHPIALSAQAYLVPFYQSFGFVVTSEPYDDFGVKHVDMTKI